MDAEVLPVDGGDEVTETGAGADGRRVNGETARRFQFGQVFGPHVGVGLLQQVQQQRLARVEHHQRRVIYHHHAPSQQHRTGTPFSTFS